ncbi:MAG: hypothetical protein OXI96_08720, partial [Acidimicrobiaceae bacterium]|nr:hypothetical protein [Acidimicrobiaceae bacterium]
VNHNPIITAFSGNNYIIPIEKGSRPGGPSPPRFLAYLQETLEKVSLDYHRRGGGGCHLSDLVSLL